MSITGSTSAFFKFHVPEIDTEDLWNYIDEKFHTGYFVECDSNQISSSGFVSFEDLFNINFDIGDYHKAEYVVFNFRLDQKKVPASVIRKYVRQRIDAYRVENGGKYPSKAIKQELQEVVYETLLSKAEPQPSVCQMIWNVPQNWLLIGTTSNKIMDAALTKFEEVFKVYPIPLYNAMIGRYNLNLSKEERNELDAIVPNDSQGLTDSKVLGYEFLSWLWYMVENNLMNNVHLGEKMVLSLPSSEKEKVTVITESDAMHEAHTAIQNGKMVSNVQLTIFKGDNEYQVTLNTTLWKITGLKTPKQLSTHGDKDFDGMFLEKMFLIEECINTVNSIFRSFLTERLGGNWGKTLSELNLWINGE